MTDFLERFKHLEIPEERGETIDRDISHHVQGRADNERIDRERGAGIEEESGPRGEAQRLLDRERPMDRSPGSDIQERCL